MDTSQQEKIQQSNLNQSKNQGIITIDTDCNFIDFGAFLQFHPTNHVIIQRRVSALDYKSQIIAQLLRRPYGWNSLLQLNEYFLSDLLLNTL